MKTKFIVVGCLLLLTGFVVFSACHIEYLNALGGHVLPRHESDLAEGKWEIAELPVVLGRLDDQFLERRYLAALSQARSNESEPPAEVVPGPPYSASEQRSIDFIKSQHDVLIRLHWATKTLGIAQYFLAPIVLLLAMGYGILVRGIPSKVLTGICGSLSLLAMFLIAVRGYWEALG